MRWVKLENDENKQFRNKKTGRMATGTDPYSQRTLDTTPSGNDPGPTGADLKKTRYKGIDFTIPGDVKAAAAKGLELRNWNIKNGRKSQPGGTGIGVARAIWLKGQKEAHPRGIRRIDGYLDRKPYDSEKDENGKWAPSYVAWLLWGGHPAKKWAQSIVKQMDAADAKSKEESIMRESESGATDLQKAVDAAAAVMKRTVKGLKPKSQPSFDGNVSAYYRAPRPDGSDADMAELVKTPALVRKMQSLGFKLSKARPIGGFFERSRALFTRKDGAFVIVDAVNQQGGAFVRGRGGIGVYIEAVPAGKEDYAKSFFKESDMGIPVASTLIAALNESQLDEASALPVFMSVIKSKGDRGARFDQGFTRAIKKAGLKVSDEDIIDLVNMFARQGKIDIKRKGGAKFIHAKG